MTQKIAQSYPVLVARSGQVNTPPGSQDTIKQWIRKSFINQGSRVLEIGCSTGFISYHIHTYTGARVTGVDAAEQAISSAKRNCRHLQEIDFLVADGASLPFADETFTHVVIGGHLPWVPAEQRQAHIQEALRVCKTGGFLLSAVYFFDTTPPEKFLRRMNDALGTQLRASDDRTHWDTLFSLPELAVEWERSFDVHPPAPTRKRQYLAAIQQEDREQWRQKVTLFIENAQYVSFTRKVSRKLPPNHPYRQLPSGGIYTWTKKTTP